MVAVAGLFAVLLMFLSALAFVLGLIRPRWVLFWTASPSRPKAAALTAAAFLACAVAVVTLALNDPHRPAAGAPTSPAASAGTAPPAAARTTPAVPRPAAVEPPPPTAPKVTMPATEASYIAAVEAARKRYAAADNELKKSAVVADMNKAIRAAVPNAEAADWIGTLTDLATNGDGDAYIAIEIAPDMTVKTWNNSISDFEDHTLIRNGSPLYQTIADLHAGSKVRFKARLIRLSGLREASKVEEPEMIARIVAVAPLDGPAQQ